ncbi:MAG: sensor histidine kinase [Mycobacteriales bacterium]
MTTGCAIAAIVALLQWRHALVIGGIALLMLAFLATKTATFAGGVATTSPLSIACVFLLVVLLRRLWQERRQALRLLQAERNTRLADQRAAAIVERARIARDLHDGLTHHLSGLLLHVQTARALVEDRDLAAACQRLDSSVELARRSLVEARDVIEVMRSEPKDLAMLKDVASAWERATGRRVVLGTSRGCGAPRRFTLGCRVVDCARGFDQCRPAFHQHSGGSGGRNDRARWYLGAGDRLCAGSRSAAASGSRWWARVGRAG